jgi:queuine/archaeosine tRNA-ribosyltransferase
MAIWNNDFITQRYEKKVKCHLGKKQNKLFIRNTSKNNLATVSRYFSRITKKVEKQQRKTYEKNFMYVIICLTNDFGE